MISTERDALSSPVPAMRPPGSPRCGVPGRLHIRAAGERPPRARPQRRGSPGPIPNPAVKPAFAESTAAPGCGRAGRRARGGRFSIAPKKARRGRFPCGPFRAIGGALIAWSPTPSQRKRSSRAAARSLGAGPLPHRLGIHRKASCAREPVTWPVPANCGRPHIVRPKARRGILLCGSILRHKDALD